MFSSDKQSELKDLHQNPCCYFIHLKENRICASYIILCVHSQ